MDPIRVVVAVDGDKAKFHTTFPLDVYLPGRQKRSEKGQELVNKLKEVKGIKNEELDIWIYEYEISANKLHAFKWKDEVAPAVVEVLKTFYNLGTVEIVYE